MRPIRISESDEVVNIHDATKSWVVDRVDKCENGELYVRLDNHNPVDRHGVVSGTEDQLERNGFRGFAQ